MELKNISKSFGEKAVLRDLSCVFPTGVTCVLGPSGCGKTTLLKLIAGLESPDSGEILGLEGKKNSAVFQEDRLFENLTAEKNVLLTARRGFTRADAQALLKSLGIDDGAARVRTMSGGMRRRVAVARALAADFDVLLLDEPCTGLDGKTRENVLQILRDACAEKIAVCVTHEPDDVARLNAVTLQMERAPGK